MRMYSSHSPLKCRLEIASHRRKKDARILQGNCSSGRFDTLRFGSLIVDWFQQQTSLDKQSTERNPSPVDR